jgi:hypothetical protein
VLWHAHRLEFFVQEHDRCLRNAHHLRSSWPGDAGGCVRERTKGTQLRGRPPRSGCCPSAFTINTAARQPSPSSTQPSVSLHQHTNTPTDSRVAARRCPRAPWPAAQCARSPRALESPDAMAMWWVWCGAVRCRFGAGAVPVWCADTGRDRHDTRQAGRQRRVKQGQHPGLSGQPLPGKNNRTCGVCSSTVLTLSTPRLRCTHAHTHTPVRGLW